MLYACFGCEPENEGNIRTLVILQDRPMFSHINEKLSPRPFQLYGWTLLYLEKYPIHVTTLFFNFTSKTGIKLEICSPTAISMESSRRALEFPTTGFCFYQLIRYRTLCLASLPFRSAVTELDAAYQQWVASVTASERKVAFSDPCPRISCSLCFTPLGLGTKYGTLNMWNSTLKVNGIVT